MSAHARPPVEAPAPAFHAGERALQARVGMAERMAEIGPRVMRDAMPDQHRELFEKLPFMLLGALDAQRQPWATLLAGAPGFVQTPDARHLVLGARPLGEGTLPLDLSPGASVGLLGIELPTRRRNRVNGRVQAAPDGTLRVAVTQSFGNCPKYIQRRQPAPQARVPAAPVPLGPPLSEAALQLLRRADTLFIATAAPPVPGDRRAEADPAHGVDVSHRGGPPGFLRVAADAGGAVVLDLPDFPGNQFFNTWGNLLLHPQAGLLLWDWARGDVLSLAARAELLWDGPVVHALPGAQRVLRLRVASGWWLPQALPFGAGEVEPAPQFADGAFGALPPQTGG